MKVNLYNVCFINAASGRIEVHTVADISARSALKTAAELFGYNKDNAAGIRTVVQKATEPDGLADKVNAALAMLERGREEMTDFDGLPPAVKADGYALAKSIIKAFFQNNATAEAEAPATVEGEVSNNG